MQQEPLVQKYIVMLLMVLNSNVVNGVKNCSKCIVLMHDIKSNTVNELDNILKELTSKGYKFGTLNVNSPTVHHKIAN